MARFTWIKLALFFVIVTGVRCLRDARLEVIPEIVERGSEAILRCHYVREDSPLYSLKWYRGRHEFYRFSPTEIPHTKTFAVAGIQVDLTRSNESQVTIRNVDIDVEGNFSCEVTADAPSFSTEVGWKKLIVASLPTEDPIILTEKERYNPGETLRANCTAQASTPPAVLSFTLNNKPVGQPNTIPLPKRQQKSSRNVNEGHVLSSSYNVQQQKQQQQKEEGPYGDLQWNELSLTIQPSHYVNGQLTLRCIVEIEGIYNATSERQLGAGLREPVPERVTSENAAITTSSLSSLTLLCFGLTHTILR